MANHGYSIVESRLDYWSLTFGPIQAETQIPCTGRKVPWKSIMAKHGYSITETKFDRHIWEIARIQAEA